MLGDRSGPLKEKNNIYIYIYIYINIRDIIIRTL